MLESAAAAPDRGQPFQFYTLVSSSFIESASDAYVDNLSVLFERDPHALGWIRERWGPEEAEHGAATRRLVERTWPEFDWDGAYAHYSERVPRGSTAHLQPSPALEALSRCATETYTAMMYRCMAGQARDGALRETLESISRDEVRHFGVFREIFRRHEARERNGTGRKVWTLLGRTERVRGDDFGDLFEIINSHWSSQPPFRPETFGQFRARARPIVMEHFPLEAAERMLFSPLGRNRAWEHLVRVVLEPFLTWRYLGSRRERADPA